MGIYIILDIVSKPFVDFSFIFNLNLRRTSWGITYHCPQFTNDKTKGPKFSQNHSASNTNGTWTQWHKLHHTLWQQQEMIDSDVGMGGGGQGDFPSEVHLIYTLKNEHNLIQWWREKEFLRINRLACAEAQMCRSAWYI